MKSVQEVITEAVEAHATSIKPVWNDVIRGGRTDERRVHVAEELDFEDRGRWHFYLGSQQTSHPMIHSRWLITVHFVFDHQKATMQMDGRHELPAEVDFWYSDDRARQSFFLWIGAALRIKLEEHTNVKEVRNVAQ